MLELKNLSLEVEQNDKKVSILDNINLTLQDNKIYVITGPNGGGKSSLCKMMMGIYKSTSGNIILDGEDITNFDITERAQRKIGYAFQQPPHFKGMTVRGLLNLAGRESKDKVDVHELLADVGDRKSTRLNSSHANISYAVFCLKKKTKQ